MASPSDVKSIFGKVLELPTAAARAAYLDEACGNDTALRAEVERLLEAFDKAGHFMSQPALAPPPLAGTAVPHEINDAVEESVGPYKLLQKLGEGGMGTVFLAEQEQPVRRRVALKVIKAGMDSRQIIARFEQERQALAMMDHPNIARVLDAGATEAGRPYVVMELVKGIPITKFCDQERLTPKERLELFIPVCQAVQHAHQKGIIHRDLKPSNVLIALYDGRPVPKVIDFGLAKAIGPSLTERTLFTEIGVLVGTLEYMAPEQAELNNLDIDTRADMYSLGAILYEMLTGSTPFTSKQLRDAGFAEMLRLIKEVDPLKPSSKLSSSGELPSIAATRKLEPKSLTRLMTGELDWIVMKCLEKERRRRYETTNALAMDIQRYLADEPVLAGPPSARYKLRKFAKKHRKALWVAGLFGLLLVVAAIISTWQAIRATHAERLVSHERDRALDAEQLASQERDRALSAMTRADQEAATARAVSDFLQKDLLGQADTANQAPGAPRNRHITVRELLDQATTRIEGKFRGQELTEAAIRETLGKAYRALGELPKARPHFEKALELRQEKLGRDHRGTLTSLVSVASLTWEEGNHKTAEALYKQALDGFTSQWGSDDLDTLGVVGNLAMLAASRGHFNEAERGFRRVYEGTASALGPDDSKTLQAINNLATLYTNNGRYADAEPLYKQMISGIHKRYDTKHPRALHSVNNLATLYMRWKKYDLAEPLFREVLAERTSQLGADHHDTITTMNDLAVVYQETNRFDEAEPLFRQALEFSRVKPGPRSPLTLKIMNCLATLCGQQKQNEEAERLFKEVLEIRRAVRQADHPETLTSIGNLGTFYFHGEAYDKAEPLLREAFTGARKRHGPGHPETQRWINTLALLHAKQDKSELTEPLWRELIVDHYTARMTESQAYMETLGALGENLMKQNRHAEAEPLLNEAVAGAKKLLGMDDPKTQAYIKQLAEVQDKLKAQRKQN